MDADQAQEIVKDPYVFDFLGLTDRACERAIEQALTDGLQDTLAELGQGFPIAVCGGLAVVGVLR